MRSRSLVSVLIAVATLAGTPATALADVIAEFDVTYTSRIVNGQADLTFVPLTFRMRLAFQPAGAAFTASTTTDPRTYAATMPVLPVLTPVTQSMRNAIPDVTTVTDATTGLRIDVRDGDVPVLPVLPAQDSQEVTIVVSNRQSSAPTVSDQDADAQAIVTELFELRDQSNFVGPSAGNLSNVPLTFDSFFIEALFVGNVFDVAEQRQNFLLLPNLPPEFSLTTASIEYSGTATIVSVVPLPAPVLMLLAGLLGLRLTRLRRG